MLRDFDEWSAHLAEIASMSQLEGATVGIEAAEYLNRIAKLSVPEIDRAIVEQLLPALGGLPFGLKYVIQKTLIAWREHNITPIFVFSGLDVGKRDSTFATAEAGAQTNALAWAHYDNNQGELAVKTFAESGLVTAQDLFRYLQEILKEEGVAFQVAPYGAWAQLAYLQECNAIDALYASSEALLYNVTEVITSWDFKEKDFVWVRKSKCLQDLSVTSDMFVDACLLAGCDLLPTLPQLENSRPNRAKLASAVDMIKGVGRGSGYNVCLHYQEDPSFRQINYLERWQKVRLSIKYHPVILTDGKVQLPDVQNAPQDVMQIVGHRLPEELYFYLSKGILGPRILNWRTSGEIVEPPPLDGGDSDEYRKLVQEQLTDVRTSAIGLLSTSLHRYYLHHDLELRCWFDKNRPKAIRVREFESPGPIINAWNVHEDVFNPFLNRLNEPVSKNFGTIILGSSNIQQASGPLSICVKLLNYQAFAEVSITRQDPERPRPALKSKNEILFNSVWRMLHLRGYIDAQHRLTEWGDVLYQVISSLPPGENEEGALIAVELARYGLLNADNMFPTYSGGPHKGNEKDKRNTLLIARVACAGKFSHKQIGYTGPLSRDLLAFHSMISAVRGSLRDLAEVCMTTLLLRGDADRDRHDWTDLALE
jgi:hypothetical protein